MLSYYNWHFSKASLLTINWAAACIEGKNRALILILLSTMMLFVGRGLIPPVFGVVAGIIYARTRQKNLKNLPSESINLAKLNPFICRTQIPPSPLRSESTTLATILNSVVSIIRFVNIKINFVADLDIHILIFPHRKLNCGRFRLASS